MADDEFARQLLKLKAELPKAREGLSEEQKDALIVMVGGPRTARSLVRAKKDYPLRRIPFLFSTLDTQALVDILANDMTAAIERALAKPR